MGCPLPDDEPDDLRTARARELVDLGYLHLAFDVFTCGSWRCKQRWCPRCGPAALHAHRELVRRVHQTMRAPILAVFKVYSRRLTKASLEAAYDELRRGIRALSRGKPMRAVRKAIGKIEAVPANLGGCPVWHVHAHVILDVDGDVDERAVRGEFRRVTRRTNSYFGVQPIASAAAVTAYITKPRDVCPEPGRFTPNELEQILGAFKHKELFVSWGIGRRGKGIARQRRPAEPVSMFVPSTTTATTPDPTDIIDGPPRSVRVWRIRLPIADVRRLREVLGTLRRDAARASRTIRPPRTGPRARA